MDQHEIERIRRASFTLARKGYEVAEVDAFLRQLADQLENEPTGGGGSEAVRRELERITERMASVLAEAEQGAERMHSEAVREASALLANTRQEAENARAEAESIRSAAEADAQMLRGQAASEVQDATERAAAESRHAAERDDTRLVELRAEIGALEARRDTVREELGTIVSRLQNVAGAGVDAGNGLAAVEAVEVPLASPDEQPAASPDGQPVTSPDQQPAA